jgi:cytochrome P450
MQRITLDVILRTLFGIEQAELRELREALARLFDRDSLFVGGLLLLPPLQRDLGPLTPWAAFMRDLERVDELVYRQIARRRRQATSDNRKDALTALLAASAEEGIVLTDVDLRDELMTLVVAGHETTGTTLCWAFESILAHPAVSARIDRELREVVGGGPLEPEHLPRLEYLEATVKEVLRLHPVVPILGVGRKLARPMVVQGYELPAEVKLCPAIYAVHRRPDLYPEPERFRPERFLGEKVDPYAWLPFGGGVRRCLGMAFALQELKVVIATVALRAHLRLARATPLRPVIQGVTISPSGGTRVVVERR